MAILLLCFLLGCVDGLRCLTPPAVICWAAHFGWLHFAGTKLAFLGHPVMLTLFTVLAVLELVNDKLPKTPSRIAPLGLILRILFGGFAGVALALSGGSSLTVAGIAGAAGAIAGAFAGYNIRQALVTQTHLPDLGVALVEDAIAILAALLIVSHP